MLRRSPHRFNKPNARHPRPRRASGRRATMGRRWRWRWPSFLRKSPRWARCALAGIAVVTSLLLANGVYQIIRKPSELLFPVSGRLNKTPAETWRSYASAFRRESTASITPELLAALAQTEASGNPVARTYWRWVWSVHPFEIYRPASSSVGMYQMTDGTFAQAKRLCIRDHRVRYAGSWKDWNSCWFNATYMRVLPGDAIELTSAYLDDASAVILARHGLSAVPLEQKERLAAVIHLCGSGAADIYAARGFKFAPGQQCGNHNPRAYIARVAQFEAIFKGLAARG